MSGARRLARSAIVVVAVVTVAVLVVVIAGGAPHATGHTAPALPSQTLNGPRVDLAQLRGRPALIHFWASWCGPCRAEAPQIARLAGELHGMARLIGVDWTDERSSALRFVREHGWRFTVLADPSGEVGDAYGVVGLPTTFVLDSSGRIVKRLSGPQTAAGLLGLLASASSH